MMVNENKTCGNCAHYKDGRCNEGPMQLNRNPIDKGCKYHD